MSFEPKLEMLPADQRALWPDLKSAASDFVLYGGTAIALRLGHRTSVDYDFFSNAPMDPDEILEKFEFLRGAETRQKARNTLTVTVRKSGPVKVSFFGLRLRRVDEPQWTSDGVLRVAALRDLAGCKMAVIQTRAESKDYLDIDALLQAGISLSTMLAAAQAIYGSQFQPLVSLKALSWYGDGDLPQLPEQIRARLSKAAAEVRQIEILNPLPGGVVPERG